MASLEFQFDRVQIISVKIITPIRLYSQRTMLLSEKSIEGTDWYCKSQKQAILFNVVIQLTCNRISRTDTASLSQGFASSPAHTLSEAGYSRIINIVCSTRQ